MPAECLAAIHNGVGVVLLHRIVALRAVEFLSIRSQNLPMTRVMSGARSLAVEAYRFPPREEERRRGELGTTCSSCCWP